VDALCCLLESNSNWDNFYFLVEKMASTCVASCIYVLVTGVLDHLCLNFGDVCFGVMFNNGNTAAGFVEI
jgi:hypothetical protein